MSLLFGERSRRVEERYQELSLSELQALIAAGKSTAGVTVTQDSAMRHDAVWSCITKKAQDVAMFPADVVVYRDGRRFDMEPPQIIAAPSVFVKPREWRYQVLVSWFQAGRAWGRVTKTTDDFKYPTRIELINDADVDVSCYDNQVEIRVHGKVEQLWPIGSLWYEPAYTVPGRFLGLSPIAYHATKIGVGLAAEKFGADFFPAGHPAALIQPERDIGEPAAKDLKEKILSLIRGNRDPIVIPSWVKYTPLSVNPSDSAFIETQKYTVEQICRVFDEDPADHGSSGGGSSLTYANRSDADLARLKRKQWWVTKMQDVLSSLIPQPAQVKLNTSASLMMTDKERWQIHDLRLKNKTQTINGVRTLEDEEPFDDDAFDEPGIPGGNPPEPAVVTVKEDA